MPSQTSLNAPYLALIGALLIAIIAIFALFQPMWSAIATTQATINERQQVLLEREAFLRSLDQKLAQLEANRAHETQLAVLIPKEDRVEDILRIITDSANRTGVIVETVNNISTAEQSQVIGKQARGEADALPNNVSAVGFSLELKGSYQAYRAFMTELERAPRLIDIQNVDIKTDNSTDENLDGAMTIRAYIVNP